MAWVRPKQQPEAPRAAGYGCGTKMLRLVHTSKMTDGLSVSSGSRGKKRSGTRLGQLLKIAVYECAARMGCLLFNFKGEGDREKSR